MVAGDPALLRSFTEEVTAAVPTLQAAADTCSTAVTSYNDAPNDLPASDLSDVGAMYSVDVESLAELAAVPAAFAALIEAADGDATMLARLDQMLLDTWLTTPSFADAEALLAALTGTPGEMADSIRALLAAGGDLSDDEVDDLIAAYNAPPRASSTCRSAPPTAESSSRPTTRRRWSGRRSSTIRTGTTRSPAPRSTSCSTCRPAWRWPPATATSPRPSSTTWARRTPPGCRTSSPTWRGATSTRPVATASTPAR